MTGESMPVKKSRAATNDNLLHSQNVLLYSTHITEGTVTAVVFATGNDTFMANLFNFHSNKLIEETPMVNEINKFVYISSGIALFIIIVIMVNAIYRFEIFSGISFSVSIFISFIPEGLIISYFSAQAITASRLNKFRNYSAKYTEAKIFLKVYTPKSSKPVNSSALLTHYSWIKQEL